MCTQWKPLFTWIRLAFHQLSSKQAQLTWDFERLKVSSQHPCSPVPDSGLQLGRARPPLQLAAPGSSGRKRPGAGSTLCQRWRPETEERVNEQPVTSAEEPDPPAQSSAQRLSKPALSTQVEKIRGISYNQWQWTSNDEWKLPRIIFLVIYFLQPNNLIFLFFSFKWPKNWPCLNKIPLSLHRLSESHFKSPFSRLNIRNYSSLRHISFSWPFESLLNGRKRKSIIAVGQEISATCDS